MKRNFFWGALAIAPVFIGIYLSYKIGADQNYILFNLGFEYWIENWLRDIGILITAIWLVFTLHSIKHKRLVWFIGLLVFFVFTQPFYWWFNSAKNT